MRVAADITRFFAQVHRTDAVLQDVHRATRLLDRDAVDMFVLHHCLGVEVASAAHRLELDATIAVELLAQAEAAVAPIVLA